MKILKRNMPYSFDVMICGDKHYGSPQCHHAGIEEALDWVMAQRCRYWVDLGDCTESTCTDHKYYQHDKDANPIPQQQADEYIAAHKRAASRCLGILGGNHDMRNARVFNPVTYICQQLKVPYAGRMCKLHLRYKDEQICKLFLWHPNVFSLNSRAGSRQIRRAKMIEKLIRYLSPRFSDCLLMFVGHVHKLLCYDPDHPDNKELIMFDECDDLQQGYMGAGDGKARYIPAEHRYYGATGCFLRSLDVDKPSYAELYPFDPVELGYLVLHVRKGKVAGVSKVVI